MTIAMSLLIGAVVGLSIYNYLFDVVLVDHWRDKFARVRKKTDMTALDLIIHEAGHCKKGSL